MRGLRYGAGAVGSVAAVSIVTYLVFGLMFGFILMVFMIPAFIWGIWPRVKYRLTGSYTPPRREIPVPEICQFLFFVFIIAGCVMSILGYW